LVGAISFDRKQKALHHGQLQFTHGRSTSSRRPSSLNIVDESFLFSNAIVVNFRCRWQQTMASSHRIVYKSNDNVIAG
jgi:hypothetical protein